jgi:hypothetical protein
MAKIKELTPVQSMTKVKELLKERRRLTSENIVPGNLIFTYYNAKDRESTFDRTPLILILKHGRSHTLGLNFHWIPLSMRINLIKHIIGLNKKNIENNKPLEFNYSDLKPILKSLGYAPCIRLYINRRLSKMGVVIPPHRLVEVARLKTETFTKGRYSATQLFQMARAKSAGKKRNKRNK